MFRLTLVAALAAMTCHWAAAQANGPVTETVMFSFDSTHGTYPGRGAPTLGKDGNLYGVTERGGANDVGAIYRLAPDGTPTLLYSFLGNGDGAYPTWSLARDVKGNLYGMTSQDTSGTNRGTIFRITEAGVFKTLHVFDFSGTQGWSAPDAVIVASDGMLYGTTFEGGANGVGIFFRMNLDGTGFTVLYQFGSGDPANPQPIYPQGGVTQGSDGNFYGLTTSDEVNHMGFGFGAAYRMTPAGVITPLYYFSDGSMEPPVGIPRVDAAGNLYFFGDLRALPQTGRIYKLDPSNTLTTLHLFTTAEGVPDYSSQLLLGKDGRLYGTTYWGGPNGNEESGPGTVFGLGLDGDFAVLHDFGADGDGASPEAGLVAAADGSLWGTTRVGGFHSAGTAYRLDKPTEKFSVKPARIALGGQAKLKWSSTDVASCAATGAWGPASEPSTGSVTVQPTTAGQFVYTLACSGAGTITRSVTLTVQ